MNTQYDDIIHLPHHVSKTRPQMSMLESRCTVSPFAALTGYDDAIKETGRLTDAKVEIGEEAREGAGSETAVPSGHHSRPTGDHHYLFRPDEKKAGGSFTSRTGSLNGSIATSACLF